MPNNEAYLETTALIDAIFKSFPQVQSIIASAEKVYTSQYAKMEIKRGFLDYLVMLHNKIVQLDTIADVHQYVSNLAQTPRRYHLGAVLDALTAFWRSVESLRPEELKAKYGDIPLGIILKRDTESFVRLWIRRLLRSIDRSVDELLNPIDCFIDISPPEMKKGLFDNRPSKCPGSLHECQVKKFFNDNIASFNIILEHLNRITERDRDDETVKRISSLKKIIKKLLPYSTRGFSNHSQNEVLCWSCGDAVHAVLAPESSKVVNRNAKHYDAICEAVNKESVVYTSPT